MRVGGLRVPFALQGALVVDGEVSWTTLATIWGSLSVASEESPADATRRITHHVVTRYEASIETGMRLVKGERSFLIRAVSNVGEADKWLKLFVEECVYVN